ncbi:MAG TPA: hypothetical protein PKH16_13690 [Aequorivita sp.]|nr:hypothetical protein [Aequorivita sp.]|tara:strand:- start:92324 stop:92737 length:414 start_codon:yes stop_codon:yes gene_type:complete
MTISKFIPKSFLIPMLAALPLFISCKDEKKIEEKAPATTQEATLEQKKQALQNVAPTSTTTTNSSNNGGAVNPPHGQPGHDCAIPVGAPLNGGSGSTNATPTTNKANAVPASISGKGVNPPHGQPGHRCDIKVGDPL